MLRRNPIDYLANPLVPIKVDRAETRELRKHPEDRALVGRFQGPVALRRVIDGEELSRIVEAGRVEGGMFSTADERRYGAQWSAESPKELVEWARGWQSRKRLSRDLFIVEANGQNRRFYHSHPTTIVPLSATEFEANECSTGLGCSMVVSLGDATFYAVTKRGLVPMEYEDVLAYARKHPTPDIALREAKGFYGATGTILGQSVAIVPDTWGDNRKPKTFAVERRDGTIALKGARSQREAVNTIAELIRAYGMIPSGTVDLAIARQRK